MYGFFMWAMSDNLCIFSRYPITKKLLFTDKIPSFNFSGAEINVEGRPILFFDTCLHYLPDERLALLCKSGKEIIAWEKEGSRDNGLRAILEAIETYIGNSQYIPIIMGGDFNYRVG